LIKVPFGERIVQHRSPRGQPESAFEPVIAISPCLVSLPSTRAMTRRSRAVVDSVRGARSEPRDAGGLTDDRSTEDSPNARHCRNGLTCLREQLLAEHSLEPDNAIMIHQQLITKLANQFRFQFECERSRRSPKGGRRFEDFLGLGL